MKASYLYAIKKVVRLKSTWVVGLIFCVLSLGISGILPFQVDLFRRAADFLPPNLKLNAILLVCYTASTGGILLMSVAAFAGFRGATMYRDEIEDGSLLVMMSKPIGRQRLILGKWFAFMTALVVYSAALSFFHNFGIAIGSGFTVEFRVLGIGFITEIGVGLIFTVMFAALALLLSFFLSATQTALFTTAIGLLAGMTSVIQPLTTNPRRVQWADGGRPERKDTTIVFSTASVMFPEYVTAQGTMTSLAPGEVLELLGQMAFSAYGPPPFGSDARKTKFDALVDLLIAKGVMDGRPDIEALVQKVGSGGLNSQAILAAVSDDRNLLDVGSFINDRLYYDTGSDELYKKLLWLDFGNQVSTLTSFAVASIFGAEFTNTLSAFNGGSLANARKERYSPGALDAAFMKQFSTALYDLADDTMILQDTEGRTYLTAEEKNARIDAALAELAFIRGSSAQSFAVVRYRDYMDRGALTTAYILIAVAMVPLSLLVLRRKDFG